MPRTRTPSPTLTLDDGSDVFDPQARPGPRYLTQGQMTDALVRLSFALPDARLSSEEREAGVPTLLAWLPSGCSLEATYDAGSWWVNLNDGDGYPLGEDGAQPMGYAELVNAIAAAYESDGG